MPQIIEVPGHGQVEFPDGMSDADIVKAIQANQPQTSPMDRLGQGASATIRGAVKGVAGIPAMVNDAGNAFSYNAQVLASRLGLREDTPPAHQERTLRVVDRLLSKLGLAEVNTPTQRMVEGIAQGTAGALAASPLAPGVTGTQLATGGAMGGAASQTAQELGAPVPVQIAADVAGNVLGARAVRPQPSIGTPVQRKLRSDLERENNLIGTEARYRDAKAQGIDLNLAEASDSGRVAQAAKTAMQVKGDPNAVNAFNERRQEQVASAADTFLKSVSPKSGVSEAGVKGAAIAQDTIKAAKDARANAANPLYDDVLKGAEKIPVEMKKEFGQLYKTKPAFREAVSEARRQIKGRAPDSMSPSDNVPLMIYDRAKKLIADDIRKSKAGQPTSLKNIDAREASQWTKYLDEAINEIDPSYAKANEVYKAMSGPVKALEDSPIQILAKTAPLEVATAPKKFFDVKHSPIEVADAFKKMRAKDQAGADQFLRGYLEDAFQDAAKGSNSKLDKAQQGNRWANAITKGKHGDLMKASMTGKQYAAFSELTSTLQATGTFQMRGSDAAWQSAAQQVAGSLGADAIVSVGSGLGQKRMVLDFVEHVIKGKANKEIAALMTDPKGVEKVLAAQKLPPMQKQIALTALLRSYQETDNGGK